MYIYTLINTVVVYNNKQYYYNNTAIIIFHSVHSIERYDLILFNIKFVEVKDASSLGYFDMLKVRLFVMSYDLFDYNTLFWIITLFDL